MTAADITAWLVVTAAALLILVFGASLLLQPRGEPFGDDPDP